MPPSLSLANALNVIEAKDALQKVADRFTEAIVFKDTDTLQHIDVGTRSCLAVVSEDGTVSNLNPSFPSTEIVVAAKLQNMYVGPRTACKEVSKDNKQTVYARPLIGNAASEKFFSEAFKAYTLEEYSNSVANHPMHDAKNLIKGNDLKKGIAAIARKNKFHAPTRSNDDDVITDFVMRRKVFNFKKKNVPTGTDFDDCPEVKGFCADQAAKSGGTGSCGLDLLPIFFGDGSPATDLNSLRSSEACILVIRLRGDWCSKELSNISFPNQLAYVQLLSVSLSVAQNIEAPNFMLDAGEAEHADAHNFAAEADEDDEDSDDGGSFSAKRTHNEADLDDSALLMKFKKTRANDGN